MPKRLHMMVPASFRRNAPIPKILALHRGSLAAGEMETRPGYRVTRPLRTLTDLLQDSSVSTDHLGLALRQALDRGLITRKELQQHTQHERLNGMIARGRA